MEKIQPEYRFKFLERIDPAESTGLMDMLTSLGSDDLPYVPPVSSRILLYCWNEVSNARERGDYRPEWSALSRLLVEASEPKVSENPQAQNEILFQIGQICGVLCMPSLRQYSEGLDARVRRWKQERPRLEKTLNQQIWIEVAQKIAIDLWEKDTEEKKRVTEMAHDVWAVLITLEMSEDVARWSPDRAEKIVPWLRKVAPDYASKRGASKKDKK